MNGSTEQKNEMCSVKVFMCEREKGSSMKWHKEKKNEFNFFSFGSFFPLRANEFINAWKRKTMQFYIFRRAGAPPPPVSFFSTSILTSVAPDECSTKSEMFLSTKFFEKQIATLF